MDHPPYSCDLGANVSISGPLKKYLAGKWFAEDTAWLRMFNNNFLYAVMRRMLKISVATV
jgi:hypothetical protein